MKAEVRAGDGETQGVPHEIGPESVDAARSGSSNSRSLAKLERQRFRKLYSTVFRGKDQGRGIVTFNTVNGAEERSTLSWLYSDVDWRKAVALKVDADWLEQQILDSSLAQLNCHKANVHALLLRLIQSIDSHPNDGIQERTNAMEALGVVIEGIVAHPCMDFSQDVFTILCSINGAERFFSELVAKSVNVLQLRERKCRYLKRMSLALMLVISTACENLQQNSAIPYLVDHTEQLWHGLCQAFESVYVIQEEALALTTLLCNHGKHEARNPFVEQIRGASVAEVHSCLYALDQHLLYSTQGIWKEINSSSRASLLAWTEDAATYLIRNGVEFTSFLGAWMAGTTPDTTVLDGNGKAQHRLKSANSFQEQAVIPRLSQKSGKALSLPKWIRSRIALLSLYELLCSSGGSTWLEEFLLHETPSWASGGESIFDSPDIKQPVACPLIFLRAISLLTFGIHSEAPYPVLLALNILRCLAENEMACRLFYATALENEAQLLATKVFERSPEVGIFSRNMQDSLYAHAPIPSAPNDEPRFAIVCVVVRQMCTILLNTCQTDHAGSKAGHIATKALAIVQRFLVFQARRQHGMNTGGIGVDWEALWQTLFVVLERLINTGFSDLGDVEELALHKTLITLLNLGLHEKGKHKVLVYYVVLRNRSLLEDWRQYLMGSPHKTEVVRRLINRDMGNMRVVVGHFSTVVGAQLAQEDGASKENKGSVLMSVLERSKTLKLKALDPLSVTFEMFCEAASDIFVLKAYTRHLIADMKKHRRFIRHVRA